MKTMIHVICPAVRTAACNLAAFAVLTLTCATGLAQSTDRAAGSGGNNGGGTIFFTYACCRTMWTMNSDGGSLTKLGVGTYGPPSMVTYNNRRWFLNTENITPLEYYPDGVARAEVFAYSEDYDYYTNNNPTTKVQLTNDVTLQTYGDGLYSLHWAPGGQKISFKARRWNGSVVSEAGIYTGVLQFGPDGSPTGLVALPTTPAISFPLDTNQWPNVRTYGWDPTATKIAYDDSAALGVADVFGSPHQIIYNGYSHTPQWSHDGKKIAFTNSNPGISTISPNGTGLKEIIKKTSAYTFDRPFWSPTDSNIVCYGFSTTSIDDEIFRATSTGASLTNLTNTPTSAEYPMGWR